MLHLSHKLIGIIFSFLLVGPSWASENFEIFERLYDTTLSYRNSLLQRTKEIELILSRDHILSGKELQNLNFMAMERFANQKQSMAFIDQHGNVVNRKVPTNYIPNQNELKSIMMALALGVTMADNYSLVYKAFHTNNKIRRLLNEIDQSYDKKLNMMRENVKDYYSLKNRKRLKRAIDIYQLFYNNDVSDKEMASLAIIIDASVFYQQFKQQGNRIGFSDLVDRLGSKFFNLKLYASDIAAKMLEQLIYDASKVFGNTMGAIKFREGRLKKNKDFLPSLKRDLQLMDVLMERTAARATSTFIPGYWTHSAIYIGTEDELRFYNVWDHPSVMKHHDKIRNGANVIEGLRSGVEINPAENFQEADTFAIIRLKMPLSFEEMRNHILRAFAQVGKVYDFSFDVQSGEKIVCSELHYLTFDEIPFNTSRILKRQTISVDQVGEQALTNRYFDVISFWLDGVEIKKDVSARYDITLLTKGRTILTDEEEKFFGDIYDLEKGKIKQRKRANPFVNLTKK